MKRHVLRLLVFGSAAAMLVLCVASTCSGQPYYGPERFTDGIPPPDGPATDIYGVTHDPAMPGRPAGQAGATTDCPDGQCPTRPPVDINVKWRGGGVRVQAGRSSRISVAGKPGAWSAAVRVINQVNTREAYKGSGVLVKWQGRIGVLSVAHVFRGRRGNISITTHDGRKYPVKLVFVDNDYDTAILSIEHRDGMKLRGVEFMSRLPQVGERLTAAGYGMDGKLCVVQGKMIRFCKVGNVRTPDFLEMSGGAQQGDSGGPIFSADGKLAGLITGTDGRTINGPQWGKIQRLGQGNTTRWTWARLPWRVRIEKEIAQMRDQYRTQPAGNEAPTMPLPPPPQAVPQCPVVDLSPVHDRIDQLELEVDAQGKAIITAKVRQDSIVQGFEDVKTKVGKEFPTLLAAYEEAKKAALATQADVKAAAKLAGGADGKAAAAATAAEVAKTDAANAKEAVGEVAGKADAAKADAKKLKADLDENTPGGLVSRLKARIETAKEEGIRAALTGLAWPWGAIAGVLLFLVYRDIRAKIKDGDPLLIEKVAASVHNRVGGLRDRLHERFNPDDDPEIVQTASGRWRNVTTGEYVKSPA